MLGYEKDSAGKVFLLVLEQLLTPTGLLLAQHLLHTDECRFFFFPSPLNRISCFAAQQVNRGVFSFSSPRALACYTLCFSLHSVRLEHNPLNHNSFCSSSSSLTVTFTLGCCSPPHSL
uniref:Uncharacterized protein n=1 Tax=Salmo trutta TaxID=8032 RepID=A0A673ZJJ3_SALTR